jgi:hypothetical protein
MAPPPVFDRHWRLLVYVVEELVGRLRGRTYAPVIKSPAEHLPQNTQQEESSAKEEES